MKSRLHLYILSFILILILQISCKEVTTYELQSSDIRGFIYRINEIGDTDSENMIDIILTDTLGNEVTSTQLNSSGRFELPDIKFGFYNISASSENCTSLEQLMFHLGGPEPTYLSGNVYEIPTNKVHIDSVIARNTNWYPEEKLYGKFVEPISYSGETTVLLIVVSYDDEFSIYEIENKSFKASVPIVEGQFELNIPMSSFSMITYGNTYYLQAYLMNPASSLGLDYSYQDTLALGAGSNIVEFEAVEFLSEY